MGDSPDSYAYDGKRLKKWNAACTNYGQPWTAGDVIGCCLDLDKGQITFYRNGVSLGVAFSNVRFGENAVSNAYFPAASVSYGERCRFNFGKTPFQYPVEEYRSLQAHSYHYEEYSGQVNYLLGCYKRVLPLLSESSSTVTTNQHQSICIFHLLMYLIHLLLVLVLSPYPLL